MRDLQQTISREEERQENGLLDLIPFHGIFKAITTGDAKRAIPYFSAIDGIISVVDNTLRQAQARCSQAQSEKQQLVMRRDNTVQRIAAGQQEIARLQALMGELEATTDRLNGNMRTAGRTLTEVRNMLAWVLEISSRYDFLEGEVASIEALPAQRVVEECLDEFRRVEHFIGATVMVRA